jgi:flap endonuclease-1
MDILDQNSVPIYVFDGKPPEAKEDELQRRRERREQSIVDIRIQEENIATTKENVKQLKQQLKVKKDDMELLEQISELKGVLQKQKTKLKSKQDSCFRVTQKHIESVKKLLDIMGIPYVQGVDESDPLLSQLCKEGLVDVVMSDDMDYLALQTPLLLKRNTNKDEYGLTAFDQYTYSEVKQSLNVNDAEFIDLCILCGCDYVDSLSRIGVITAYKLIIQHRTIENILDNIDHQKHKITSPCEYMEQVRHARHCFQYTYSHTLQPSNFTCSQVHINAFRKCLKEYCTFGSYKENQFINFLTDRNDAM